MMQYTLSMSSDDCGGCSEYAVPYFFFIMGRQHLNVRRKEGFSHMSDDICLAFICHSATYLWDTIIKGSNQRED